MNNRQFVYIYSQTLQMQIMPTCLYMNISIDKEFSGRGRYSSDVETDFVNILKNEQ